MSNTPILGAPELALSQAIPETTVNEAVRYLEQGAGWFRFKDRDLTAPPGSPADGDCYLVAASATGAWAGHDGDIAFYMSTGWLFIDPKEGMGSYIADEDIAVVFDGSAWGEIGGGGTTAPSVQSVTSASTVTPAFGDDLVKITAQAAALLLANWSGTAIPGWGMAIRIKDNGTARAISYGANYRAIGVTLPTTTVIGKTLYLACIWNNDDGKIDVVAVAQEA